MDDLGPRHHKKNLNMFWKKQSAAVNFEIDVDYADEVVSKIGGIYADLNDAGHLIKSQSDLPCSWFSARECFSISYKNSHQGLPKSLKDSYKFIYEELAFFVDKDLYQLYNKSLKSVIECIIREHRERGTKSDEKSIRLYLVNSVVMTSKKGDEILNWLLNRCKTCSEKDILLISEVLMYCTDLRRSMQQEWIAFINVIPIQQGFRNQT